jgi:hypothetical protein
VKFTFSINGVVFKNIANYYQTWGTCSVDGNDSGGRSYVTANTDRITVTIGTATTQTGWYFGGDWELNTKPTWAY